MLRGLKMAAFAAGLSFLPRPALCLEAAVPAPLADAHAALSLVGSLGEPADSRLLSLLGAASTAPGLAAALALGEAVSSEEDLDLRAALVALLGDASAAPDDDVLVAAAAAARVALSSPGLLKAQRLGVLSEGGEILVWAAGNAGEAQVVLSMLSEADTAADVALVYDSSVNTPPVAAAASFSGQEDALVAGSVFAADAEQASGLSFQLVTPPVNGAFDFDAATGNFSYLPPPDFNGQVFFVFRPFDGRVLGEGAEVTIVVSAVNDPPLAFSSSPVVAAGANSGRVGGSMTCGSLPSTTDPEDGPLSTSHRWQSASSEAGSYVDLPAETANAALQISATHAHRWIRCLALAVDSGGLVVFSTPGAPIQVPNSPPTISATKSIGGAAATAVSHGASTSLPEATSLSIVYTVSDVDGDAPTVSRSCVGCTSPVASYDEATRTFSWTPSHDFIAHAANYPTTAAANASREAKFSVDDGFGGTATLDHSITISDVDRAPSFTANPSCSNKTEPAAPSVTGPGFGADPDGDAVQVFLKTNSFPFAASAAPTTSAGTFSWPTSYGYKTGTSSTDTGTATYAPVWALRYANGGAEIAAAGTRTCNVVVTNTPRSPTWTATRMSPGPSAGFSATLPPGPNVVYQPQATSRTGPAYYVTGCVSNLTNRFAWTGRSSTAASGTHFTLDGASTSGLAVQIVSCQYQSTSLGTKSACLVLPTASGLTISTSAEAAYATSQYGCNAPEVQIRVCNVEGCSASTMW